MKFDTLRNELQDLNRQIQDVQSTAYAVLPVEEGFSLIAYMDIETTTMGYTVVNSDMLEVKLFSELPASVLVSFGKFVEAIERWQTGDIEEFPFSEYARDNLDGILSKFQYVPPDNNMDGDEGKIS